MTTYNYAIVTVMDNKSDNGQNTHYLEVRTYEYLEDARADFKDDAVQVYKDAEEDMNRYDQNDKPYHLEVVKLKWSGNYSEVVKSYTN